MYSPTIIVYEPAEPYEGALPQDLVVLLQKHGKSFFDPLRTD